MRIRNDRLFLLPATLAAAMLLGSGAARAGYALTITSTGALTSLSDPGDILGAGTSLSSGSYTISVYYAYLPDSTLTTNPGVYTAYNDIASTGSITVTVNGHTMTTAFTANGAANVLEQTAELIDSITGTDASGNQALVLQTISTAGPFTTNPDFQQSPSYVLGGSDSGSDFYNFTPAGSDDTISLSGVPSSVNMDVPEPASVVLLGGALLSLGLIGRRRRTML
jgi:hypothetical protein